jgi:hypothetical protein
MIKEFNTSEIFQKHFRNDEAWFYHLNEIEFDLFVTLHFKNQEYYANTIQSDCNRKRVFRETFGNITKYLRIPRKSLCYFGVSELDCNGRMHSHTLVKTRKDVNIATNDLAEGIKQVIGQKYFRISGENAPRSVEVIEDSRNAANYILKIKTEEEKQLNMKCIHHSKNFREICQFLKNDNW